MNFEPILYGPLFIRDAQDINLVAASADPVDLTVSVGGSSWTIPVTPVLTNNRYLAALRMREILSSVVGIPGLANAGEREVPLVTLSAGDATMSVRAVYGAASGKTPTQLAGHWLSWRDQVSMTHAWGRERLTFLAGLDLLGWQSGTYSVKAKIFLSSGDPVTVTLTSGTLQSGCRYVTVDASYATIAAAVSASVRSKIRAWDVSYSFSGTDSQSAAATINGYPLRLIIARDEVRVKEFVFCNSFGVEDRVYSSGRSNPKLDGSSVSFLSGASEYELRNDSTEGREVYSGRLGSARESALWLDFLKAHDRYILASGGLARIIVDSQETDLQDNALGSVKFTYHLGALDNGRYFNDQEGLGDYDPTQRHGALYIGDEPPSEELPSEDLFFLKTRLDEFPVADLSEEYLFLVQDPLTLEWCNAPLSDIKEWLQQVITHEDVHVWSGPWEEYSAGVAGYALAASLGKDLCDRIEALEDAPAYQLPIATDTRLGGIKVGSGLEITPEGVLSAVDACYFEPDPDYEGDVSLKTAYAGLRIPGLRFGAGREAFDLEVRNVAAEGETPVYALYTPLPLITGGDQILGSGTPGGGTPTGVSYLHELLDVGISNPMTGQILAYNATLQKWVNAEAPAGSVQTVAGVSPDANGDIPVADLKTALSLGSAAYKDTSYFAAASHTHSINEVSGLDANLTTISGALQSLQAQIDSVASRDCFDELTATAVTADRAVASEMYAERYYLTNGLYFYVDIVDGVACVHLNAPFITDGDQILGDGTPGGGGGTGATYLWQLDDVDVPSVAGQLIDGQALVWDAASSKWTNRNITQGTVTRVDVGSTQYSPTDGVVSLPAYPTTLPASDVYAWAKALTKPSYALTEITGAADVQAIEALTGTSGLLRKTAANTWELDTNSYVTSSGVTSITAGTGLSGGTITGTGTIAISSTYQDYIVHGESAYNSLTTVSSLLQGLQAQIDAVASRDMFEELAASAFSASVAAISELRVGYAYAERYYLSDAVYFTAETVNGVVCVKLNSPLITTGDQILGDGTPGGGGGGDISYLYELTDVDDNLNAPASGTILQWYSNKWIGTAFTSIANGDLLTYASGKWTNVARTSVGIVTDATTSTHGLMSAADKTKLDGINTTYISNGQTAYENLSTVSAMLQSLQKQVDSVASRDMYEELGATAFYSDVAGIGSLIADNIELGGESLKSIPNSYLANHSISINGSAVNLGGSFSTASITAGTAGTSSATSGASISVPYVTMNAYGIVTAYGTHTHSVSLANLVGSSAVGSASLPVYYNGSALAACTGSSLFSAMSSGASTNLSVTVAGQTRTATLYATYDSASENISDKFGIVSGALQSLQKQIDSVASRSDISDFEATTEAKLDYVCDLMRSLQSQIDSVASRTADVSANGYFDVISVGRAIYGDVLITSGDQTLSDERRKTITREITLTAEQIASCRAVAFDWKDKPGSSFGSIAQDWQKILPESVNDVDDTLYHFYGQSAEVAVINLAREVVELKKIIKRLTS